MNFDALDVAVQIRRNIMQAELAAAREFPNDPNAQAHYRAARLATAMSGLADQLES